MSSSSANNKMTYNVYLVDDNEATQDGEGNEIKYFDNEHIEFALIKNGTYVAGTSSTVGKKLTEVPGFSTNASTGEGLVLENQEIIANTKDNYKLRIWISDDVNYSNDIDANGTMTGKFNGYKYSLKVKVTSGVEITTTVSEPVGRVIVANLADENGISAYGVSQSQDPTSVTEWIDVTSDETAKSNVVRTATGKVTSKTIQHKVESYGTYYVHVKNTLNEITTKEVNVKIKEVSKDASGAATPVITGNLVPVIMNGSDVIKADTTKGWYNYDQKIWANAVILEENAETYEIGDIIPEEVIESYFVWIPRYEYKIFNDGNYTGYVEQKIDRTQEIEIKFVDKDKDAVQNGSTVGTWLTHPAFTNFDVNGMWVGKFENGYSGVNTGHGVPENSEDLTHFIIKPNSAIWTNNTVGYKFKISYDYQRDLDSHMMKNTEWGAVAYLSHSKYGSMKSVRHNNNRAYVTGYSSIEEPRLGQNNAVSVEGNLNESVTTGKDGKYTLNYFNVLSVNSSTTGNYSGIYDMSGGGWDYVMGITLNNLNSVSAGNMTNVIEDFFTNEKWDKYYDKYVRTNGSLYNNRILGDATGEMGPFYLAKGPDNAERQSSGWYDDLADHFHAQDIWIMRGGNFTFGLLSGTFAFASGSGNNSVGLTSRTVLTP